VYAIDAGRKSRRMISVSGRENTRFASQADTVRYSAMESRSNVICAKLAYMNSLALSVGVSNQITPAAAEYAAADFGR